MVVDRLANPDEVLELRSAAWTLVSVLPKTIDLAALARDLDARRVENPGLFDHDAVVLDLSEVHDEPLDVGALAELLRSHRMMPVAVKGGSPAQTEAARAAGLADAPESLPLPKGRRVEAGSVASTGEAAPVSADEAHEGPTRPPAAPADGSGLPVAAPDVEAGSNADLAAEAPLRAALASSGTLTIDRPLRSGQQIYARGGDLVVLAAVSVGAEVLADGHIHVYAPLRGRALAGARGNTEARIFTTCLEPQLISIAGIYRTTEVPLADDVLGKPAQVRLDGEKLVIEPLVD